jgi:hypothetical protein
VHSINVLAGVGTVLDLQGGDLTNSFFHINGVTGDGNNLDYHLLKNHDTGNGTQHVRFTNCHFLLPPNVAKIDINRVGSTSGQTVVEIVGSRGLNAMAATNTTNPTPGKVKIKGASSTKPSRIIVRDSELASATPIVDPTSSHYTENRLKNWSWGDGLQTDI